MLRRIPEKYSWYWLIVALALFGVYFLALRGSRLLLGLEISSQNLLGFAIIAFAMSLAVVVGGFFGAKIYSVTALMFSGIAVVFLLYVTGTQPYQGWADLISVIGFMFWGGMAVGGGIIVQLIYSIRASRKQMIKAIEEEKQEIEEMLQLESDSTESDPMESDPIPEDISPEEEKQNSMKV